ncbi:MAG TPA: 50S ribosomal protein L17 [Anaerolineae bacterium]|nr:50S ribosomal protein L17 [Anaerolineae bacterium]HID84699.1 50S ribosomal protein L17 [Anaerolineales bacterium]HIQ09440.1 50S ribosomal protein L17 [Anaerolineaceae bacterium]
MRHKVAGKKLSRSKDARKALRRNLVRALFDHERIRTTKAKAKVARREAERLITIAKRGNEAGGAKMVHARRIVAARLGGAPEIVKKLFDDIAPRYAERPGGYTRIIRLGPRASDSADMVLLELVEE